MTTLRTPKDPEAQTAVSALQLPNEVRHEEIPTGGQQTEDLYFRSRVGRKDPRSHRIVFAAKDLQQISEERIKKDMEMERN